MEDFSELADETKTLETIDVGRAEAKLVRYRIGDRDIYGISVFSNSRPVTEGTESLGVKRAFFNGGYGKEAVEARFEEVKSVASLLTELAEGKAYILEG